MVDREWRQRLQQACFLPEDRLSQVVPVQSGVPVTAATLATMNERAVERLPGVASHIQDPAAGTARVKYVDETGFQIAGQTQYPHAICTHLAAYSIGGGRSALLSGVSGIVVHDHRKPYFTIEDVEHTMCYAHHLQALQMMVDIEGEARARLMQQLLRRGYRAARIAYDPMRPISGLPSQETNRRPVSDRGRPTRKETVA